MLVKTQPWAELLLSLWETLPDSRNLCYLTSSWVFFLNKHVWTLFCVNNNASGIFLFSNFQRSFWSKVQLGGNIVMTKIHSLMALLTAWSHPLSLYLHTDNSAFNLGFILVWIDWHSFGFFCFSSVCLNHLLSSRVNLANKLCHAVAFVWNLFLLMTLPVLLSVILKHSFTRKL